MFTIVGIRGPGRAGIRQAKRPGTPAPFMSEGTCNPAQTGPKCIWEEVRLLVENKYAAIAAVVVFLLALWLTEGSMTVAFGAFALVAGLGWAVRRLQG